MDQPRSHTTPGLALRSNDAAAFSPHPKLPPLTAELLEYRHRKLCEQGNDAATWLKTRALERLVASDDAIPGWVHELKQRKHGGGYVRPTTLVDIWRRPDLRPDLKRLYKTGQGGSTWQDFRTRLQFWAASADHERQYRQIRMAIFLESVAELVTRPSEIFMAKAASIARAAVEERQAAETLRAAGFPNQAGELMQRANMLLNFARYLAEKWTPDEIALIQAVRCDLSWQLGFLGYGLATKLVGAALGRPLSRWRAYRLIKC